MTPDEIIERCHDQLGSMIDQVGQPDYSMREFIAGVREVRDSLFDLKGTINAAGLQPGNKQISGRPGETSQTVDPAAPSMSTESAKIALPVRTRYYLGWFQSMGYAAMGCGMILYIEPHHDWKVNFERARNEVCKKYSGAFGENDCDAIFIVPSVFSVIPDDVLEQYYLHEKCPTAEPGNPMTSAPDWWWVRLKEAKRLSALNAREGK